MSEGKRTRISFLTGMQVIRIHKGPVVNVTKKQEKTVPLRQI